MDKYIGRLLDNRYEILEVIGTGGMAVVYKARCHRLNRLVAIKILKDDYLHDEEFRRRFHSESQAVAMLSHPNIVSVYDVSSSIMADYIVMELVDGITLKQYMEKKGILNWKETLHFGIQIAKALEHAHGRGIVHRDIKPHNVMVLKNGSVKVMDFGIARMMSQGNTLTKEALGSVHYISPEQAKGGRVDNRSDIYSLGVVMYEMMAGRPPYDGDSPVSVAIQHINGGAVMPSTLNPNIPDGLEQIIMKAMAHEISDRYVSATRMLSDMDEFRKNPSLLFDYNTPPLDAVTKMPPPLVLHEPKPAAKPEPVSKPEPVVPVNLELKPRTGPTAAEKAAARRQGTTTSSQHRSREREAERRRRKAEESSSRAATIAIIVCSLVIVVALGILLYLAISGDWISKNEELVTVPNLVGQEYTDGMTVNGFTIKEQPAVYNDEIPKGQIIHQEPEGGEKVVKGSTIYITVSLGPKEETVELYDLADIEVDRAVKILNDMSLDLEIIVDEKYEEYHATVAEGKVIRTDPPANTVLTVGQKVIIYVSKGPGDGDMPDVVGKSLKNAKEIIDKKKLELVIVEEEIFDSELKKGYVVKTEPAAGSQVKAGQQVKVYVSKGPELKVMPNVVGMTPVDAIQKLEEEGFVTLKYEGNRSGNVVMEQSATAGDKYDVKGAITLTIGTKKDVTISLEGAVMGTSPNYHLTIKREDTGEVLLDQDMPATEIRCVLKAQVGNGSVTYLISIDGTEPWKETVQF